MEARAYCKMDNWEFKQLSNSEFKSLTVMGATMVTAVEFSITLKFFLGVVTVGIVSMLYFKLDIIVN